MNMHTLYIHNISIVQKLCMYSSCIYFINEQKIPFTQYIKCVNVHLLSGAYRGCLPFQVLPQSSTFHGNRTSKDASIYVLWLESFLNPKLNPQSKCVKWYQVKQVIYTSHILTYVLADLEGVGENSHLLNSHSKITETPSPSLKYYIHLIEYWIINLYLYSKYNNVQTLISVVNKYSDFV